MRLINKENWPRIRERYETWWEGGMLDRPLVQVTAPRSIQEAHDAEPAPTEEQALIDWFTDPEKVLPRLEQRVDGTYWAGDAFPLVFPMSTSLPAIETAYLGAPYTIVPRSNTGWTHPVIEDWGERPTFTVDADNWWWRRTQELLDLAAQQLDDRAVIGIPDLQGGGEILVLLRGTEQFAMDLYDHPEAIGEAMEEVNEAWLTYYNACFETIHRHQEGYVDWLAVWSEAPAVTVECDFSAMISPQMFQRHMLPPLERQIEWIPRTIYHLDGPGELPHLDAFLGLPDLDGIQWVPGAGTQPMIEWLPLLKQIQDAGKKLVIACQEWEVKPLLEELRPETLLISTSCGSETEADALMRDVRQMFGANA